MDITGIILANQWDENGNVIGVSVYTDQEEIYIVAHNRMESELINHIHKKVGIQGKIMERLDGRNLIYVRSFQAVLDESILNQKKQRHNHYRRTNDNENMTFK